MTEWGWSMGKGVTPWMSADQHTKYYPLETILACMVYSELSWTNPFSNQALYGLLLHCMEVKVSSSDDLPTHRSFTNDSNLITNKTHHELTVPSWMVPNQTLYKCQMIPWLSSKPFADQLIHNRYCKKVMASGKQQSSSNVCTVREIKQTENWDILSTWDIFI
jgi:hypothetical protein